MNGDPSTIMTKIMEKKSLLCRPTECSSLEERMHNYFIPGISIAVVNNFKVDWAEGFGVKRKGDTEKITSDTLFLAGSISKPVAALGALHLVEKNLIDLDDDVNDYLQAWKIPENGNYQPRVTLRQILSHTAGLTVHGFPGYPRNVPLATELDILDGNAPANTPRIEVNLIPGLGFRYSGGGYTVLQRLMADILDQPFPDLMKKHVLDPLAMSNSTFKQPLPENLRGMEATGHHHTYGTPIQGKWHIYPEMAAAGLWTTPTDLAKFVIEVQKSKDGLSNKLISKELTEDMLSPQFGSDWGLGFGITNKGDNAIFQHGGWDEGFVSQLIAYADLGKGIVVMTNKDYLSDMLIAEVVDTIANHYKWPEYLKKEEYDFKSPLKDKTSILGKYKLRHDFYLYITKENERIYLRPTGQPEIELSPKAERTYFSRELNIEAEFSRQEEEDSVTLILRQNKGSFEAKKIEEDVD
ncbi:MAG: serine hydrolase domain-containing protein [Candidatus Hodarchaeales archaeon]|jgi:CubicO group peptidase (beta-lactamase class C family)